MIQPTDRTQVTLAPSEKVTILIFFLTQLIVLGGIAVTMWTRLAVVEVRVDRIPVLESKIESLEARVAGVETQVKITNKRDE